MGHYNSFLVKVWTEGENTVRGYIQHVGTKEAVHFLNWEKMIDFMLTHLSWKINHELDEELEASFSDPEGGEPNW